MLDADRWNYILMRLHCRENERPANVKKLPLYADQVNMGG